MKIGDMVQWKAHSKWDNQGLGVIIDSRRSRFRVVWFDDIEDYGWEGIFTMHQWWYCPKDFEENITLAVETIYEDR